MTVISFGSCERSSNANAWLPDMLLRQDWHHVPIEFEPHSPPPHRLTLYLEQFLPQNEELSLPPKCKSDLVKKGRKPKPTKHNDDMILWISSKHREQKIPSTIFNSFLGILWRMWYTAELLTAFGILTMRRARAFDLTWKTFSTSAFTIS